MTSTALAHQGANRPLRMGMGTLEDPRELGQVLAQSGFFSDTRDAAQAVVKVLAGQELGFGPIASMTGVYIVKGRVTLSANLIAAAIKRHPLYDFRVRTLTNDACDVLFLDTSRPDPTCAGRGHVDGPDGPKTCDPCMGTGRFPLGSSEFTMADARTAGLAGGENWKKYPRSMLFARAISNGAKWFCPDVFAGAPVYTPDELGAEIDGETGEILNPEVLDVPMAVDTARVARDTKPTPQVTVPAKPKPEPAPKPTPGPAPATEPAPKPVPEVAPEPEPEPVATLMDPPANGDPTGDDDAKLTDEQAAQVVERLHSWGTPEAMWRMALMTFDADQVADLTVAQARELMKRARMRYGAAESKA